MSDPTPVPTPATSTKWAYAWDQFKTILMGIAIGIAINPHVPQPAPLPIPIPSPSPLPAPPIPIPSPIPTPVPLPQPPAPPKHAGTLFLSYIEPLDTTPQASAIRDAAVGTDWKGLNCRWRSYTDGQATLAATGLKAVATALPSLVIQEIPSGVDPDGANLPPSPVIDVIVSPGSLDVIMARVKSLRGE